MDPAGGFSHAIPTSCFVCGDDKGGFGGWIDFVS